MQRAGSTVQKVSGVTQRAAGAVVNKAGARGRSTGSTDRLLDLLSFIIPVGLNCLSRRVRPVSGRIHRQAFYTGSRNFKFPTTVLASSSLEFLSRHSGVKGGFAVNRLFIYRFTQLKISSYS